MVPTRRAEDRVAIHKKNRGLTATSPSTRDLGDLLLAYPLGMLGLSFSSANGKG